MTEIGRARALLLDRLQQYDAAGSQAEIEQAILALHTALEEAFCAYLEGLGYDEVSLRQLSFPELVNMIYNCTNLFEGDSGLPRLLTALNTTRNRIAHPRGDKPSPEQIANDAEQLARLARRFWPGLFGETYPIPLVVLPPRPAQRPRQPLEPPSVEPKTQQPSLLSKSLRPLRPLWRDEFEPRFQVKLFLTRLIAAVILFTIAKWCGSAAIGTARWPEPIKYGGAALFLVAVGLFVWGGVVLWRIILQLRLRGLLVLLGVSYLLLISITVLTSDSPLPVHQEVWLTTKRLGAGAVHKARDVFQAFARAPEEFRFAYTGHRRPMKLPDIDPEDTSYLTPIPANYPAQSPPTAEPSALPTEALTAGQTHTPSPSPAPATNLLPPDCPHPQARLTAPLMDQVVREQVQAEGTASIENFDYYKFEIRREDGDVEDEWHWIGSFETPVEDGVLGTLRVSDLPEGVYTLRLTVVNREGNYPFPPCDVRVHIMH